MEIINKINNDLTIFEENKGLTFGTDAYLLASFVRKNSKNTFIELGAGTGVISLLLLSKDKVKKGTCVEIQEKFCRLCRENTDDNGYKERIDVINCDVNGFRTDKQADIVVMNPPYLKNDCGKDNENEESYIARHETSASIFDFMKCAQRNVKDGGTVYAVYRPDRSCELFCAMREAGVEPKRVVYVYPTVSHRPCVVLVEGKKGAKEGCTVCRPLIIYKDGAGGEYTDELKYIYENMEFTKDFTV